jgi:hypothetical protein
MKRAKREFARSATTVVLRGEQKDWPDDDVATALLKCAGVSDNPETRKQLRNKLLTADMLYRINTAAQYRIPPKIYDRTAVAARALLSAIAELNRRARPRISPGVTRRGEISLNTEELDWLKESDRDGAEYYVRKVLAVVDRRSPDFTGSLERGQPSKSTKDAVVATALRCLENWSERAVAKVRLSNRHLEFVELFYETVTGEDDARGKLEWQIRKWFKWQQEGERVASAHFAKFPGAKSP